MSETEPPTTFKNEISAGINWYVVCCVDGSVLVPRQRLLVWRDAAYAATAEIERLAAENARLRETIIQATSRLEAASEHMPTDHTAARVCRWAKETRAALTPTT